MTTLEDGIKILFNEIDVHSKVIKYENVNAADNFSVLVRTKLAKLDTWGDTCNKWVEKFTIQTNSKWVVKATFPKAQRMEYRKVYVCKENSAGNRNQNRSCPGKIDIKVKKITESTLKKDTLLKSGYNGEIKVIFNHSHER